MSGLMWIEKGAWRHAGGAMWVKDGIYIPEEAVDKRFWQQTVLYQARWEREEEVQDSHTLESVRMYLVG